MKKGILFAAIFCAVTLACFAEDAKQAFSWKTFDDKARNGTSEITMTESTETANGKDFVAKAFAGKVTTKYQYGFVGAIAIPDAATLEIAKGATGITLKVAGDGKKYRVRVETSDIGDSCYYGKEFTATKAEPDLTIPYKSMVQESWGVKKSFNPANITQVSFQTVGQPISSFAFKVIDLAFYK
jgi:hypothetical protein